MIFPDLDLDSASSLVFPPESHFGRAQYRFEFAPEGTDETIVLWARLVRRTTRETHFFLKYDVALWPEGAEKERVFFAGFGWGFKRNIAFDDYEQSGIFDWEKWRAFFESPDYFGNLKRYWAATQHQKTIVIGILSEDSSIWSNFRWRQEEERGNLAHFRFLQMSTTDFEAKMCALWDDENSEMRGSLRWKKLSNAEKDEAAFACAEGDWDEVRKVASWILKVRAGREKSIEGRSYWAFTNFPPQTTLVLIAGKKLRQYDPFLQTWQKLLFDVFQPIYWNNSGLKKTTPPFVESRIGRTVSKDSVSLETPSHHEILEARAQLLEWARENLGEKRARELMEF